MLFWRAYGVVERLCYGYLSSWKVWVDFPGPQPLRLRESVGKGSPSHKPSIKLTIGEKCDAPDGPVEAWLAKSDQSDH